MKQPKILIIEDEPRVAEMLSEALEEMGYTSESVGNGTDGLERLLAEEYDLAIVDVMLPGIDGYEVVRQLRAVKMDPPVLMLTARQKVEDRIEGLDAGADDYLPKPFALGELMARVRALLRRAAAGSSKLLFDDLEIDTATRKVQRGSESIYLSSLQFNLLFLFMRHPGEVLSKQQILSEVWDDHGMRDPNTVEVFVSQLRAKLDGKGKPRLIHTVRGGGYVLEKREYAEPAP